MYMYNQIIMLFIHLRQTSPEMNANSRLIVSVSQGVHGNWISLPVFLLKKTRLIAGYKIDDHDYLSSKMKPGLNVSFSFRTLYIFLKSCCKQKY